MRIANNPRTLGVAVIFLGVLLVLLTQVHSAGAAVLGAEGGPTLTIASSHAEAVRGEEVTFTITASSAPKADLLVNMQVQARGGTLDETTSIEKFFAAGESETYITLVTDAGNVSLVGATVTFSILAGTGYTVGGSSGASVSVRDGTVPTPTPTPGPGVRQGFFPPPSPSGVSASGTSRTSIRVSWSSGDGIASYRLERWNDDIPAVQYWDTVSSSISGTSYTVGGLRCGRSYSFRVSARGDGVFYTDEYSGTSSASGSTHACPPPPPPPTPNATATAIANAQATATAIANAQATAIAIANAQATATAIANAQATATAIANAQATATAIANAQATATAIANAQATATAIANAQATATAIANAQATATAIANAQATATAIARPTDTPTSRPVPNAPAPSGVTAQATGLNSITVSWNTVTHAYEYRVERRSLIRSTRQTVFWDPIATVKQGTTSYEHTSDQLTCGEEQRYRVRARGDGSPYSTTFGAAAAVATVIPCPVAAPAPTGVMTATTGPTSIRVSWNSVVNAADYRLQRYGTLVRGARDNPRQTLGWIDVAEGITSTSYEVTAANSNELNPITCGQTHQFRVSARGDGWPYTTAYVNHSKTTDGSTQDCPRAPAPTGVTALESGPTSITVSWNAREGVVSYQVERFFTGIRGNSENSQSTRSGWAPIAEGIKGTSHVETSADLTCGDDHEFRVSGKGDGTVYAAVYGAATEVTGSILCAPPGPAVSTSATSATSITVSWLGLQGVTYALTYVKDGATVTRTIAGAGVQIDQVETGLEECTEYSFAVTGTGDGVNYAARPGTTSTKTGRTVCLADPPAPNLRPSATTTRITITWYGEQGVTYAVSSSTGNATYDGADSDIEHTVTGLEECTTYSFTVTATGDGESYTNRPNTAATATKDVTTDCLPDPTTPSPSLGTTTTTSITFSWSGEQGVTYTVDGPGADRTYRGAGPHTHTETGLTKCRNYSFTVTARGDGTHFSDDEDSVTSATIAQRTVCPAPTTPSPSISATTTTSITFSWSGEQGVTYTVDGPGADATYRGAGLHTHEETGLMECTDYSFTVTARGDGTHFSDDENSATSASVDGRTLCPVPAPTGLVATPTAPGAMTVSWNTQTDVAAYKLEYTPAGTPTPTWTTDSASIVPTPGPSARTSHTVDTLTCGTAYAFRVSGKGDGSPYSTAFGDPSEVTETLLCIPTAPTVQISDPTLTTLKVTWNALPNISYAVQYRESATTGTRSAGTRQDIPFITFADSIRVQSEADVSRTVKDLTCGTNYDIQVTAVGIGYPFLTGPDYENTGSNTGSTAPCLAPTPVGFMIDNTVPVTQTSITFKWNTTDEVVAYKLERSADNDENTWPQPMEANYAGHVIENITGTTQEVTGLKCGVTYYFRLSGKGDGDPYNSTVYGNPTDPPLMASTTVACTPQGLNVTPLAQRRALLTWNAVGNVTSADSYMVKVSAFDPMTTTPAYASLPSTTLASHIFDLDSILLSGEGLADAPYAYQVVVQAKVKVPPVPPPGQPETTMTFTSTPIVIIDTPILSANGNSPGAGANDGKAALKWERVETTLNDMDYSGGAYSFRYRSFTNFEGHPHTEIGGKPGQAPDPAAVPPVPVIENYAPAAVARLTRSGSVIDGTEYTIGSRDEDDLTLREIYAIQLIYEVSVPRQNDDPIRVKVFAGRDAYVWPSDRGAVDGERVATFPLNHLLTNKTYTYRVCENTFPAAQRADWKRFIDHAFSQWESATGDLNINIQHDDSLRCADYSPYVSHIRAGVVKFIRDQTMMTGVRPPDADIEAHALMLLDEFKNNGVLVLARLIGPVTQDRNVNEVYLIRDVGEVLAGIGVDPMMKPAGIFQDVAKEVGHGWCSPACADTFARGSIITTDIKLRQSKYQLGAMTGYTPDLNSPDVNFNSCPVPRFGSYQTLVHEMGHALGIRAKPNEPIINQDDHHSTIAGSVMSYETRHMLPDDPDCSPHPLDIMAIYAIYQTD